MRLQTIFIIALALFIPLSFGCDNDNNSNAQDMDEPGVGMVDCPCYTKEDVLNMGNNSTDVVCIFANWGLILEFQGDDKFEANTLCNSDGTNCTCGMGKSSNVNFKNINAEDAGFCSTILINSLVQSALDGGIMVSDCTFEP